MIRVVLVDDHPDVRWITGYLLDRHPEVVVVGEAATGLEALEVVAQVQPDVVLMDVQMPLLDGIAAPSSCASPILMCRLSCCRAAMTRRQSATACAPGRRAIS